MIKYIGTIKQRLSLIVVEDGLVQCMTGANSLGRKGLYPYCSGQWSRTMEDKKHSFIDQLKS